MLEQASMSQQTRTNAKPLVSLQSSCRVVGIDWLEASVPWSTKGVRDLLARLGRRPFSIETPRGTVKLERCVVVRWDSVGSLGATGARHPWIGVRLSGSACAQVGQRRLVRVLRTCLSAKGKVSRLDLAMTGSDLPGPMSTARVLLGEEPRPGAVLGPHVRTRVRRDSWDVGHQFRAFYVGSPTAQRLLRVYDKRTESRGAIDGQRWELQLRDESATAWAGRLLEVGMVEACSSCFVSFLDVVDARGRREPWYSGVVGGVRAWRWGGVPRAKALAVTAAHLRHQWGPWLLNSSIVSACARGVDPVGVHAAATVEELARIVGSR